MEQFMSTWREPPDLARGITRWWWYGCAVTKEEISRELHLMKEAGIGGVELQILYPVQADDKKAGIRNIPYFSPDFFEMLSYALETSESLGLTFDYTPVSSWPYGGPFIPKEMAPQEVIPYQIDVYGPCEFSYDFTTRINGDLVGIVMGRMEQGKMLPESIQDLSGHLKEKDLYGWPWGQELEPIQIPEGNYKIVAMVVHNYRQMVGIPSREGGGYAMDHCRKDVTDFFFQNAVEPVTERFGKGRIRDIFCDSIELAGNNWTENLPEEFQKRRGYDLTPFLYALWGEVGDLTEAVRYDYYLTMSELTLENFFGAMTNWCHRLGSFSRIQAHGTWADMLQAYGKADVPEGETFGPQDCYAVNSIQRRFASSAAHIYGHQIVSNESFTWLRMPRFLETLENIKAETDAIFLDGMNQIVNHGYAYAPKGAPAEGVPFYASSHLCSQNLYWPYYREVADYIQKMTAVLQMGQPHVEVGIYLPQGDVWSENPMSNLHMGMKLQEAIGWGIPDTLQKLGYYFDYLNDEALTDLGEMQGGLRLGGNTYRLIFLPGCKRIPQKTAAALQNFVASGGILVSLGKIPRLGCGMAEQGENNRTESLMADLFSPDADRIQSIGEGSTLWAQDGWQKDSTSLVKNLDILFRPDVRILSGSDSVGYLHRSIEKEDLYFMANISSKSCEVQAEFRQEAKSCRIYDALTGDAFKVHSCRQEKERFTVSMNLDPFQSILVIFVREDDCTLPEQERKIKEEHFLLLNSDWTLRVPAMHVVEKQKQVDRWEDIDELKYYSGSAFYEKQFFVPQEDLKRDWEEEEMEFESIHEIAEIYLNEKFCGILWKRPYRISVRGKLKEGENRLCIKVTNRMINEQIDPDHSFQRYEGAVMDEWPYFTEVINQVRDKRVDNWRERLYVKEPVESGISGDVKIHFIEKE